MAVRDKENGKLIGHGPCGKCGSSDALARYEQVDGSVDSYCWACPKEEAYQPAEGGEGPAVLERRKSKPSSCSLTVTPTFLEARQLTQDTCQKWGYGIADYRGQKVQVAQYRDKEGTIVAQKIRTADKKFPTLGNGKELCLYGQWLWREGGKRLVITEGELDAMSWSQIQDNRWPVVSLPNGAHAAEEAIRRNLDYVESFDIVILMFDADEHGREAALDVAKLLTPGKARIVVMPEGLKDASDALQQRRSAELTSAFWDAKTFRPDGILDVRGVIEKMRRDEQVSIIGRPMTDALFAKTRNYVAGQIWTVCAGSGMGKTEYVREMAVDLLMQGKRVGHVALEESVGRTLTGYVGMFQSKRLDIVDAVDDEGNQIAACDLEGFEATCEEHIEDKLFLYDDWGCGDIDNLMVRIRYLRVALHCDVIILDHLSIIVSGQDEDDERKTIDMIMTRLRKFTEETGTLLVLVSHLKRPKGTPHEEGGRTHLGQLRGSAAIGQLSDIVIGLERDQQAEDGTEVITIVRILKNRRTGMVGIAGYMEYNVTTGRFLPSAVDNPFIDETETKPQTKAF